jgi:hypothetical protein
MYVQAASKKIIFMVDFSPKTSFNSGRLVAAVSGDD